MAEIITKGKTFHIRFYDSETKTSRTLSTKLPAKPENIRKATKMAAELQVDLRRRKVSRKNNADSTILEAFQHFKRNNETKSKKTKWEYDWFFKHFQDEFSAEEQTHQIAKLRFENWIRTVKKKNYQINTQIILIKQGRHFLRHLIEYEYTNPFIINSEIIPKRRPVPKITFTDDEMKVILDNLKSKNDNFRMMVQMIAFTGLRPTDVIKVKSTDVNFGTGMLQYYSIKTKTFHTIPLHKNLLTYLKEYVEKYPEKQIINYASHDNMTRAFQRYLAHLGLKRRGNGLRTLRKTFISRAVMQKMQLQDVSRLVGHTSISTTQKYYLSQNIEALKDTVDTLII